MGNVVKGSVTVVRGVGGLLTQRGPFPRPPPQPLVTVNLNWMLSEPRGTDTKTDLALGHLSSLLL